MYALKKKNIYRSLQSNQQQHSALSSSPGASWLWSQRGLWRGRSWTLGRRSGPSRRRRLPCSCRPGGPAGSRADTCRAASRPPVTRRLRSTRGWSPAAQSPRILHTKNGKYRYHYGRTGIWSMPVHCILIRKSCPTLDPDLHYQTDPLSSSKNMNKNFK